MASRTSPQLLRTAFLDGLRGLAALYVVFHHARYFLHEGSPQGFQLHPQDYSLLNKAVFYALTTFRYGNGAVIFFFVLSGFVIHLRYSRQLTQNPLRARFEWGQYMIRRARRLYPPLLLALGLTAALDYLGMRANFSLYTGQTPYGMINDTMVGQHGWLVLLGNLVFLMGVYVPCFGTNGPLWSLMYEWWFYVFYPLFWVLTKRSILVATAVIVALFAASFHLVYWPLLLLPKVFSMMILWWMGALLADVYAGRIGIPFVAIAPLALLLPVCVILHLPEIFLGLAFVGLIAAGFAWQERGWKLTLLDRLKPLGEMSYTVYVCHMPMMALMSGWLIARSPTHHLPQHFAYVFSGAALIFAFSWFAHLLVERPFIGSPRRVTAPQPGPVTRKSTN